MTDYNDTDALIVIDLQYDFVEGGALEVEGGMGIVYGIEALSEKFKHVIFTQDWHPKDHKSFASAHGADPFTNAEMPYGDQTLWPDHCVQGERGAMLINLPTALDRGSLIIRKGMNPEVDSYSAFYENDKTTKTGLAGFLRDKGIKRLFFVGLAYDFCVAYSALDAVREGFEAVVIKDLTRAINMPNENGGTVAEQEAAFAEQGVIVL